MHNEGAPEMEQPKGERADIVPILKEGGLDITDEKANEFMEMIERSDQVVRVKFNELLIKYDEANGPEAKAEVAKEFAEAVQPYL